MLQSLREETEGKLQMLLSPRKNTLDSLFKEVRVFKETVIGEEQTRHFLNHAFARVTPAVFVIFVVFGGLRSEALVFRG